MDLSWAHHYLIPINPTIRLLNTQTRFPYSFGPRLFDFQSNTEINFQLKHFISELTLSMDEMEVAIAPINSRTLHTSLNTATNAVRAFQQQINQRKISEELTKHKALCDRILDHLLVFGERLNNHETDVIEMRRENVRLINALKHSSRFEFTHTGEIEIPSSEINSLQDTSFLNLQHNSAEKQSEQEIPIYNYDLDTVLTPNDLSTFRQSTAQICSQGRNVKIISGSLELICIFWRHVTMISRYDHNPLSAVQRSWSYEQARSKHILMEKYYREYKRTGVLPAFV